MSEVPSSSEDGQTACTENVQDVPELSDVFARWQANPYPKGNPEINKWIDMCERETHTSNLYRYWLPRLYAVAPARSKLYARYFPHKWLSFQLFAEIQDVLSPDKTKSCFDQEPIAKRVAPYIDKWRAIKKDWEAVHGPTAECLIDILYDASTDHPAWTQGLR